jgi:hypothetical protein
MLVSVRNKIAGIMAIIGGILLFFGGGTGMVGFLTDIKNIIDDLFGYTNETLETIFWILIFIAALGGIAVIIGGYLIYKNRVVIGKIFIILGTSLGIFGLIFDLIISFSQGNQHQYFNWITSSFIGIGILLSIASQYIAKRPGVLTNK